MPLRIYLDSSDYAVLYRPERDPERRRVLDYLLARKAAGDIEIGFSYPIVWELLQEYRPAFEADRLERARCIHRLCDQNAYRFMPPKGDAFSRAGHWYPGPQRLFGIRDLEGPFIEELTKQKGLNRHDRRSLQNTRVRHEFLRRRPEMAHLRRVNVKDFILPASFLNENVFHRYLIGDICEQDADRVLLQIITDLELFIHHWYSFQHRPNPMMESLFRHMQSIEKDLATLRTCYLELLRTRDNLKRTDAKLARQVRWDTLQLCSSLRKGVSPETAWIWELSGGFFEDIVVTYVEQNMRTGRDFKRSDLVDMMHASYIPYCDLWRGDADFANMLVIARIQFKERIVPKLRELPDRIESALE